MKIGVLFRGQFRYSEKFISTFRRNVLQGHECYCCGHFWDKTQKISSSPLQEINALEWDAFRAAFPGEYVFERQKTIDEIKIFFKAKDRRIHNDEIRAGLPAGHGTSKISEWYSSYRSFKLYEAAKEHCDVIVLARTDLAFYRTIDLSKLLPRKLYVNYNHQLGPEWVSNQFFASRDPAVIRDLSEISFCYDKIISRNPEAMVAEKTLATYLRGIKNIEIGVVYGVELARDPARSALSYWLESLKRRIRLFVRPRGFC